MSAALRVMGQQGEKHFQNYHRVLNRAKWSSRALSRILLLLLVKIFVPAGAPIVVGIDETIERRRGGKIEARGIYRDPVRRSYEFFVKTSGLRWVSMMLLAPVPWAARVWALPDLSVLAPSERYYEKRKRRHKKITDWGRQMILQLRRWLPDRTLVVVADSTYAALELLSCVAGIRQPVTVITRLRLDAALYDPAPERKAGTKGRPRLKGARQPTLQMRLSDPNTVWQTITVAWYGGTKREVEVATGTALWYHTGMAPVAIRWVLIRDPEGKFDPQALLCTDQSVEPAQIISWFVGTTGRLRSLSMRYVLTLVSRHNANGRIWLFCEPLPPFWGCFRSSPSSPINCWVSNPFLFAKPPGIAKLCPPFLIPWLSFANAYGPFPFLPCRLHHPI